MKTTNKMTVILLMLNHFNLFSKPYIFVYVFRKTYLFPIILRQTTHFCNIIETGLEYALKL